VQSLAISGPSGQKTLGLVHSISNTLNPYGLPFAGMLDRRPVPALTVAGASAGSAAPASAARSVTASTRPADGSTGLAAPAWPALACRPGRPGTHTGPTPTTNGGRSSAPTGRTPGPPAHHRAAHRTWALCAPWGLKSVPPGRQARFLALSDAAQQLPLGQRQRLCTSGDIRAVRVREINIGTVACRGMSGYGIGPPWPGTPPSGSGSRFAGALVTEISDLAPGATRRPGQPQAGGRFMKGSISGRRDVVSCP
jgi:hypothetical protein